MIATQGPVYAAPARGRADSTTHGQTLPLPNSPYRHLPMPSPTTPPPLAIFHGKERFLQLEQTERLRAALAKRHGEVSTVLFDGPSCSAADVLDECRSMSLMMTHKLVIVDTADRLLKGGDEDDDAEKPPARGKPGGKSARELFEGYAAAPDAAATLVLRAESWRPGNLDKAVLKAGGVIVKCEAPNDAEAAAWCVTRAKEAHDAVIDRAAAALLVEYLGPDMGRLDGELAKLAMVNPGKPITADTIRLMTGVTREEDFWTIQPSLLSGDPAAALAHLAELVEVSRHDAAPLSFAYVDLARKLHAVSRGLANRESPQSLMSRLRLWGPTTQTLLDRGKKIRPEAAAGLLHECVLAVVRQRTSQGDPIRILEALTVRFTQTTATH